MQGHYGTILESGVIGSESELDRLRAMDLNQRLAWHKQNCRHLFGGMYATKVDGRLAVTGYEDEFEEMFARFNEFVARGNK